MNKTVLKLTAVLLLSAPLTSFGMPILVVQGGILMGASGVDVGGTLYDVEFVDGTCASVYGACDQSSFAFQTEALAASASQALMDSVLTDSADGLFDTFPNSVFGCGATGGEQGCLILVPYAYSVALQSAITSGVINYQPGFALVDLVFVAREINVATDTATNGETVWTRWSQSQSPSPIPEPGTLVLTLLGLLAMRSVRRHNAK